MKMNRFTIEHCPSKLTSCLICGTPLKLKEIRVTVKSVFQKSKYYHLNCYTPKLKQFICINDLNISLDEESMVAFNDWISAWNSNYIPLDAPITLKEIPKMIESTPSKKRRVLIEIYKFLEIKEILNSMAYVNKEYYHTSWEPEVWRHFIVQDFGIIPSLTDFRTFYINCFNNRCIECKEEPDEANYNRCPFLKLILCKKCKMLPKYTMYPKGQISLKFDVDPKLLDLKFGIGYGNQKLVYQYTLLKALEKYRNSNKNNLVSELKKYYPIDHQVFDMIDNIDVKAMDLFTGKRVSPLMDLRYSSLEYYQVIFEYIRSGKFLKKSIIQIEKLLNS